MLIESTIRVSIAPYTLTHFVTKACCDLNIIVILTRELSYLSRIMPKLLILTFDSSKTKGHSENSA